MKKEFYKMDLHIHTPASKCYSGARNDEEYFEILRSARNKKLDIIAITDHNTIAGYERLVFLKNELKKRIDVLSEFKDSTSKINEAIKECKDKLELFSELLIIPGVEITLNPGVHMIVLSDDDQVASLSDLLDCVGYTAEKQGSDSSTEIDIDIKNFLSNPRLKEFVVIAPHIDSDKGIYNMLSGLFRAEIMRSPVIDAFSCSSITQRDKIENLFSCDPNYKRDYIPAFVSCSDAHNTNDIGKKYSYIKLNKKTLNDILGAFQCPEENISDTCDQRLEKDLYRLIEEEEPVLISDSSCVNSKELSCYICATLNKGTDYIIIGVTPDHKTIGIKAEASSLEKVVDEAIELISSQYLQLRYYTRIEKLGNGNIVGIIFLHSSVNCLWYIRESSCVYVFDDHIPKPANIQQIESLVHENTLCELGKFEDKNTKTILNIETQLTSITNTIEKHELIQEIMLMGIPLLSMYDLRVCTSTVLPQDISEMGMQYYGQADGNVYYVLKNPLCLSNAVLRYSCPTVSISDEVLSKINTEQLETESIIISQQGGTHIATSKKRIFGNGTDYLIIYPKSTTDISIFSVLAWLKSSLFAWYVYKKYDTTNIYLPEVLKEIVLPYELLVDISDESKVIVQDVLAIERSFLKKTTQEDLCGKCVVCEEEMCLLHELENKHNNLVAKKTRLLDQLIFENLGIDDEMQDFIRGDLEAADIFTIC